MPWLYEPKHESAKEYLLPIHSEDMMMPGFTYKQFIDTFNASEPVKTEDKLKEFICNYVKMMEREMWENYDLCREKILEECGIKEG